MAETQQEQTTQQDTQLKYLRQLCMNARANAGVNKVVARGFFDDAVRIYYQIHDALFFSHRLSPEELKSLRVIHASALESYELAAEVIEGSN